MASSLLTVRSGHTAPCTGCVHERCSALCWYHLLCGGGNVRSGPYACYEDVWGSGGMAALILDLSAKFSEWSVFCSGQFTHERDHPVPIEQRTDWPHQSRSGPCEDKYRALSGNQTVISRTHWQCELYNNVALTRVAPCNSKLIAVIYSAAFSCTWWSPGTQKQLTGCSYCAEIVMWCEVLTCCVLTEQPTGLTGAIE